MNSENLTNDIGSKDAGERAEDRKKSRRTIFGMFAWYAARFLLLAFLLLFAIGYYVYQSAQNAPDFYQTAITLPPEELESAGKQFESRVFNLQNATQEEGVWQVEFSEGQINGWLGSDLPQKFPDLLPPNIVNPRVAFEDSKLTLVFRLISRRFKGYVVAEGDAFCTEQKNQIAIRIYSAKAGVAPLPIGIWADAITKSLRGSNLATEWTEIEGDPVALITLPTDLAQKDGQDVELEVVKIVQGKLIVGGKTVNKPSNTDDVSEVEIATGDDN